MNANGLIGWYFVPFKSFAKFTGRPRRKEYWIFVLANAAISGILSAIGDWRLDLASLGGVFVGVVFVPTFAVAVRRLHDVGKDGVFLLWGLLPVIGWIVLFVNLIKDSNPGVNSFGDSPKDMKPA